MRMGSICWLAIVALVSIAGAQEFTRCNPSRDGKLVSSNQDIWQPHESKMLIELWGTLECDPVPAIGRTVSCDFTKGKCDVFREVEGGVMKYDDEDGAQFIIEKDTDFPMIETPQYMFFGRLEVELKAMPGQGLVTSLVLQSDALDEVSHDFSLLFLDMTDNRVLRSTSNGSEAKRIHSRPISSTKAAQKKATRRRRTGMRSMRFPTSQGHSTIILLCGHHDLLAGRLTGKSFASRAAIRTIKATHTPRHHPR